RPIIAMSSDDVQAEGFDKVFLKPLNFQQLRQFLQQLDVVPVLDLGLSEELIQLFYQTLAQDTASAINALQQADWQSMARIAHKVKGGAASFGELTLSNLANDLMQLLKSPVTEHTKQQASQHFVSTLQQVGSQVHG
ncbi:Hpt domain-containing protein, partial [Arsukibacterium sp.]|uniref:Hpt domain-containing protein n=1 Tax=Arsukibacterium sp. TaxID=1977258 RepID=UPI002FDA3DD5